MTTFANQPQRPVLTRYGEEALQYHVRSFYSKNELLHKCWVTVATVIGSLCLGECGIKSMGRYLKKSRDGL
jgi:hypothetical protein